MQGLSDRQTKILDYIQRFMREAGFPPSIRDIQDQLKISSTSVVAYNLKKLEERGHISRTDKVSRGIKLPVVEPVTVPGSSTRRVSVVGAIAAGQPMPMPESTDSDEFVDVPLEIAPTRLKDVYALRVKGNSMVDALIADGDIVLLRYQNTADNGQMAAVHVVDRNEVTLKKVNFEGDRVKLTPANPTMDAWYEQAANIEIKGRVVGVVRALA